MPSVVKSRQLLGIPGVLTHYCNGATAISAEWLLATHRNATLWLSTGSDEYRKQLMCGPEVGRQNIIAQTGV